MTYINKSMVVIYSCFDRNKMLGSDWIIFTAAVAISHVMLVSLTLRLRRLHAKDRTRYGTDLRNSNKHRAPWQILYFSIIILVDTNVLSPQPWYSCASAAFMIGLTSSFFRL